MALDPDIKKILCNRRTSALSTGCADLIAAGRASGDPPFSDDQLKAMVDADLTWIEETERIINAGP